MVNKTNTIVKTDTIKVPIQTTKIVTKIVTQIKEVNKLYWWQKGLMYLGLVILIYGIVILIIKIKKLLKYV